MLLAQATAGNRDNVLSCLNALGQQLDTWRDLAPSGETAALEEAFSRGLAVRGDWMLHRTRPALGVETAALPAHPNIWMRMLGWAAANCAGKMRGRPKRIGIR